MTPQLDRDIGPVLAQHRWPGSVASVARAATPKRLDSAARRWSGERTIGWRAYRTRLRTHQTENTTNAIARTTNNAASIPWNNQYRSYG